MTSSALPRLSAPTMVGGTRSNEIINQRKDPLKSHFSVQSRDLVSASGSWEAFLAGAVRPTTRQHSSGLTFCPKVNGQSMPVKFIHP